MPPHAINQLLTFDLNQQDLVFDMDGTLLHGDLGETIFYLVLMAKYLGISIEKPNPLLKGLHTTEKVALHPGHPVAGILLEYLNFKNSGALAEAYRLTAEYFDTLDQMHLSNLAHTVLTNNLPPFSKTILLGSKNIILDFYAQADSMMIKFLHRIKEKKGFIWIVSGSPQLMVSTFCRTYGIPTVHAYGVFRQVDGTYFVPYQKTKVTLLEQQGVKRPFLVAGNSRGDLDMFKIGENVLVRSDSTDGILELALQNKWWIV